MGMPTFDEMYLGQPAWDVDRPQEAFVALAQAGRIDGSVLDVGCGTGENAIFLAQRGHRTLGIDLSRVAIDRARAKARARRSPAEFAVGDALDLTPLGRAFDTVIDSGLFHAFEDDERPTFVHSLRAVLPVGGRYFMLCFSHEETDEQGPRRISPLEIRATFADGWRVEELAAARFIHRRHVDGARAWLAALVRTS